MTATRARHRSATTTAADEPPFPPVRIVSGPAFELAAELAAFTSGPARASLESGKPWIRDVRRLAGPELIRRVEGWGFAVYGELASFALETRAPYQPARLVARLRELPADVVRRRFLGAESAPNRAMVSDGAFERGLAGDRAARAELRAILGPNRSARQSIERLLTTPPDDVQSDVASIVETWASKVFPAFERDALDVIARDTMAKERQLSAGPARDVVRAALNGVDVAPPDWAKRLVVVPTVAMRPFVATVENGPIVIYLCSVDDGAFDNDPSAPPRRLVKVATALGDELRLRILHALADGELSASDIADLLGVDRTSLHHHLGILRSAGLVTIHAEGLGRWRYARRTDGVAEGFAALTGYLGEPTA